MKDYSNYHGTNMNEKISHDGLLILERSLNGFEGYDVVINDTVNSRVLIYQKYDSDSETKKVIGRIEDIEKGNLLKLNDMNWLIITLPEDNKIYRKAEMKLCNSTFPIQSDKTSVLLTDENGNQILDDDSRPIYVETGGSITNEPCIVETKVSNGSDNTQLPLPEGRINITMKYQVGDNLTVNSQFQMYGNTYKIRDIDYTKVINGKGIMKISAERVVSE